MLSAVCVCVSECLCMLARLQFHINILNEKREIYADERRYITGLTTIIYIYKMHFLFHYSHARTHTQTLIARITSSFRYNVPIVVTFAMNE